MKFLLRTYVASKAILEACDDVFNFHESSAMNGEAYHRVLWGKALRCDTAVLNRRLKSPFIDRVLSRKRGKTCQFHSLSPCSDYETVVSQRQALGDSVRVTMRPATMVFAI